MTNRSNHSPDQFPGTAFRPVRIPASKQVIHSQKLVMEIAELWAEGHNTLEIVHALLARGWSSINEGDVYNLLTRARAVSAVLTGGDQGRK